MKLILLVSVLISASLYAKTTGSFLIEIEELRTIVSGPKVKGTTTSVMVKNSTDDDIRAELRLKNKVVKRLIVKARTEKVTEVKYNAKNALEFIPLAPPGNTIYLKYGMKAYEIPEKK